MVTPPVTVGRCPTVTVICATHNRPYPLECAIQSVRNSTFADWELIVVGDACTDRTADLVASFADPRIRFLNLAQRCGDQSGPNNAGMALARGRYVAFLNHDDMFFADHLECCVEALERTRADLVWTAALAVTPRRADTPEGWPYEMSIRGVTAGADYSPTSFIFASSWVFRRELAERVGPWASPKAIYNYPSQDWLFRAARCGARLHRLPRATVVIVPAGPQRYCYHSDVSHPHEWASREMQSDPSCRERWLESAAIRAEQHRRQDHYWPSLRTTGFRLFRRPLYAVLSRLGVHPRAAVNALRRRHGGRLIDKHREKVGAG